MAMDKRKLTTLLITSGAGLLILLLWWFNALQGLESKSLDYRFRIRGPIAPSPEIAIVAFDEESFKSMGRWPWPRQDHAKVVEQLTRAGARAIVFDMLLPEPDKEHPESDLALARALGTAGRCVIASYYTYDGNGTPTGFLMPIDNLASRALVGFANIMPEYDGVCRKIPLYQVYKEKLVPGLALAGLSVYLKQPVEQILAEKKIALDQYNEMGINFSGGYESFPYYSFIKVLNGEVPAEKFKDKIVVLGGTASGLFDLKPIPFSPTYPGVEIHANTMSNILLGNFMRPWPMWVVPLLIIVFALVPGFMLNRLSPLYAGLGTAAVFVLFTIGAYVLFTRTQYLEYVAPAFSLALSYVGVLFYRFMTEEKEKRHIRKTFSQYLSPRVMDKILSDPSYLKLGGQKQTLSVLFSDIRGFTTITEALPAEELVALLNEYLSKMVEVVFRHDGTLDKFIGDAVMAYWGAPIPQNDHPRKAVLCALDMIDELKKLQEKWQAEGKRQFEIGIGVNTGEMTVGNMGSKEKMEYTVIGDNVNLGARLESETKNYASRIIVSEMTYQAVKDMVEAKKLGSVKVKGKTKPVEIYSVLCRAGEKPDRGLVARIDEKIAEKESSSSTVPAHEPGEKQAGGAKASFNPDERMEMKKAPHKKEGKHP